MSLIFIIGPPAVGKMTVGQELADRTGYKLFHNHVAIEVVAPYFSYGSPEGRSLVGQIRRAFFDAFAADRGSGYIFTFVWAFGEPGEREFIEGTADQFRAAGHDIFWVELEAAFEERLVRNRSENRLDCKPTKRDVDWSDKHIREVEEKYRFNSAKGELVYDNYLRIENTDLSAAEAAEQICSSFDIDMRN
ncbi:MAG: AAA family ATPase [Pseudomonadota bacterium]